MPARPSPPTWPDGSSRPAPVRSATPLAGLAVLSAALVPTPARTAGLVAASLFAAAAAIQGWSSRRALDRLRDAADRTLLRSSASQGSPRLAWRLGEVGSARNRERLARDLRGVLLARALVARHTARQPLRPEDLARIVHVLATPAAPAAGSTR